MTTPDVPTGFVPLPFGGPFGNGNGPFYLREAEPVALGFRVEQRHTNPGNVCHGGMMATFCDMLMPVVALRTTPAVFGHYMPTISLQLDYLAPAPSGAWVEGRVEVLRVTRTMMFAQALVTADGVPVARTSGVYKLGRLPAA